MKAQYMKQVKKELHIAARAKKEILRDLDEMFSSAMEHGENEQQVIERLGTPREFADNIAEQFGIDHTALRRRKKFISSVTALLVAVAAFLIYALAGSENAPKGAIGQADAMTNIQVQGGISFDFLQIVLLIGLIATVFLGVQIFQTVRNIRRQ